MNTTKGKTTRRLLSALAASFALFAFAERAEAQEILLTGPLAGAPAVRKLRLHRQGRFEIAPAVSFTLLDEYQRTIFLGARLNYNLTDWLGIGVFGAYGGLIRIPTALSDHIQDVNAQRRADAAANGQDYTQTLTGRLTGVNLGTDFKKQLGGMDWFIAPQLTLVPFRGKIALFQSIYLDTDLYIFGGPAFVNLLERKNCDHAKGEQCDVPGSFNRANRMAIAPTFGLGLNFFPRGLEWGAVGFEWRALPFAWNTAGFDTAGTGKDNKFPDNSITADDQRFKFNQMLTVSFSFYLPTKVRISE
ncbi:MAG TPA: hypothetical protein VG937_29270 [Polyangiaceae bacterium]|nr:hypothetical protein [Polyangiaceae bacterium]